MRELKSLRTASLLNDDVGRFLRNHVHSADDVEVRDLGEDTGVDDAERVDTLDPEAGVKDRLAVAQCANGDGAASMMAPRGLLDPRLDFGFRLYTGARGGLHERTVRCNSLVEHRTRVLDALVDRLQIEIAADGPALKTDVRQIERVRRLQGYRASVVMTMRFEYEIGPSVEVGGR